LDQTPLKNLISNVGPCDMQSNSKNYKAKNVYSVLYKCFNIGKLLCTFRI